MFGSQARGEASDTSDVDILYELSADRRLSLFGYLKAKSEMERLLQKRVDLIRKETLKPALKPFIAKDLLHV